MKSQTFNPVGDVTGPSMGQDVSLGFGVGFAAAGSAITFHMWDGGAAKNDPSFGVSRGFGDVSVQAALAAVGAGGFSGGARGVFYSGQGALNVARGTKGIGLLLEDTVGGKILNYIDANIYRFPSGFWKLPSAIFALNAKGTAVAFLRNPSAGSVWNTVEQPILKALGTTIIPR